MLFDRVVRIFQEVEAVSRGVQSVLEEETAADVSSRRAEVAAEGQPMWSQTMTRPVTSVSRRRLLERYFPAVAAQLYWTCAKSGHGGLANRTELNAACDPADNVQYLCC